MRLGESVRVCVCVCVLLQALAMRRGHMYAIEDCPSDLSITMIAAVLEMLSQPVSWHREHEPGEVCCVAICMPHMLPSLTAAAAVSRWSAAATWQLPHTSLLTTIPDRVWCPECCYFANFLCG